MIIASVFPCICITLTLEGNKRQEYIIKTCDGSGNVNSITITMLPISDITAAASDLTANNVTSDSRAMLQNMQTILAGELQNSSLTESEKQALENAKADLEKALTDHEKTLIGTDSVKKLQNARKALTSAATTPSTGDSIQIALWAALLFISGSGLLGVAYRRKSKRVEN